MRITALFRPLALVALIWPIAVLAQKHPNIELGFNAEKLYQFSELDSVNLYNGNLILQMPIGQTYQVNALQYRFTLVYNSKVWDHETFIPAADQPGGGQTFTPAYANMRSNAGAGWRLSFGRLIEPGKGLTWYNKDGLWNYEDATGAEHSFGDEGRFPLHPDQANAAPVLLTLDQSAIRMVRRSSTVRDLEFPNGETHRFEKTRGWWYLRKISDRFGNYVEFSTCWLNSSDRREAEWHISDSQGRKHRVVFGYRGSTQTSVDKGQNVERIELDTAASGSTGSTPVCGTGEDSGKSIYRLNVVDSLVDWACGNTVPPDWPAPERADFPLLSSIILPDQTSFTFSYHHSSQTGCEQGALQTMTLPTKGSITYDYTLMALPESFCWPSKHGNISPAVFKKTVTSPFEAMPAVTEYRYTLAPKTNYDRALACMNCNGGDQCQAPTPGTPLPPEPQDLHRWTRTSVVSPAVDNKRVRSDHYFYTWTTTFVEDQMNPQSFILGFGQALTSGAPSTPTLSPSAGSEVQSSLPDPGDELNRLFLSTRLYENCTDVHCASGRLLRSNYRKLPQFGGSSIPNAPDNHNRIWLYPDEATMTMHDVSTLSDNTSGCASGSCWTLVKNSEPDGVHKYRKTVTSTNLPDGGGFEVFINYRQWTAAEIGQPSLKWLLNVHDWTTRTEGNDTAMTNHCFDTDGFLTGVRSRINSAGLDRNDVLTLFSGTYGNVEWEKAGLANDDVPAQPCQGSSMLLHYLNQYTYSNGVFVKAQACVPSQSGACTAVLTTQHIDAHRVGVPTQSYDPAGVATKYDYDEAGRLWKVKSTPIAGQTYERTSQYTYAPANAALANPTRASVNEVVSNATGALLTDTTYEFDHLGRVAVVQRSMPDNAKSTVETTYDAMGRTSKVTQPFDPSVATSKPLTTTKYDALGRPVVVTGPDGTSTQFEYAGDHVVGRTTAVATSETGATSAARVTEKYDAQRRLRSVTEDAVNTSATTTTGGASTTTYSYDVGGRLTGVAITGGGTTQQRSFVYDKRGFLLSETHPESGTTTYSEHDARGRAGKQVKGGRTVVLDYDDAGRLASVGETVNGETQPQPLKSFEFATANGSDGDLTQGKLVTAKRYNRLASAGQIVVTDTYEYKATGGRVSRKTTKIESVTNNVATTMQQFAVSPTGYDGLGAPTGVNMPTCAANGCTVSGGISALHYTRDAGYLKQVQGFGTLSYHPNAMVRTVVHNSAPASTDTYNSTDGLPRPSSISFSGGTLCIPPAPPTISAPASVCPSSNGNQASVAASNATHTWRVVSGGTLTSSATGNSVTFSAAASGTVVLAVKATANGCSSSESTRTVSIQPEATATITAASPVQITRGDSATLSVSLTGTAPWVIAWSDGVTETTSATQHTRSVTPSVTTTYTITSLSSAGCASGAQSGSRTVTVLPPSPASVTATTVPASSRQVRIQWTSVSNVDQYVVERASVRGGTAIWTSTVPATTLELIDTVPASSSPVAYIYYVRAVDSAGTQSARGAHDFATTATVLYADSVVQKRVTGIQSAHVVELRGAIDALRFAFGLAAAFAGQLPPSGLIRAADFTSLAAALNPVRSAHGLGSFQYTGTGVLPVTVGGVVIAEHIEQLRRAVE